MLKFINKILYHFEIELVLNRFNRRKRVSKEKKVQTEKGKAQVTARNQANQKKWKRQVHNFHPKECWCCGSTKGNLQIHHILPISKRPDLAKDIKNTIMLCEYHHSQYHRDCKEI